MAAWHDFQWPRKARRVIVPLFLPFQGCPSRCLFCAQEIQTGSRPPSGAAEIKRMLKNCAAALESRAKSGRGAPELAFYGGTFTAFQEDIWRLCLDFARSLLADGLISSFRCSTRPDSVGPERLHELAEAGCRLVELGIQSFNGDALKKSGRAYGENDCLEACEKIAAAGIALGVQLMPGMPGSTAEVFLSDVQSALEKKPELLRFYPCLVLEGSALAEMWRAGHFRPWELAPTVGALARGWLLAAERNVPVIRMGLAPQAGLEESVLAGPRHPSLGEKVLAQSILMAVEKALARLPRKGSVQIQAPLACQGAFWGWRGELRGAWRAIGVDRENVKFWRENVLRVTVE